MSLVNRYFSDRLDWRWVLPLLALYLVALGVLETRLGLGPGEAHIDESTYLYNTEIVACGSGIETLPRIGEGYFCLSDLLDKSLTKLVGLNIALYLATSLILMNFFNRYEMDPLQRFLLFMILCDPYRAHLAIHVLKESFLFFGVVLMFYSRLGVVYGLIISTFFRVAGPLYTLVLVHRIERKFLLSGLLIFGFVLWMFPGHILYLLNGGNADMVFQTYDKVPTFNQYGLAGDILRAISWPILLLSGMFYLTSPALLFTPIALVALLLQIWSWSAFKKPAISLGAFLVLATLAFMVPGFTGFARYAYPVVVVLPLIMLQRFGKKLASS